MLILRVLLVDSPNIEAVSFDVFDTLVQRTLPHPDVTKIPAARKLQFLLKAQSIGAEIDDLHRMRVEIELEFRNRAAAAGHVFLEWVERAGLASAEDAVQVLITTELEAEYSVVYPTPGMVDLVESLQRLNVSLFFVTDMYLRHWMVEEILNHCGYGACFTRGYVSCEFLKAKYSGSLFQHILEQQNIPANGLIHVGDRPDADMRPAIHRPCRVRAAGDTSLHKLDQDQQSILAGSQLESVVHCFEQPRRTKQKRHPLPPRISLSWPIVYQFRSSDSESGSRGRG
jgi:FMN phosphatase YigB (HAD superfamily)